MKDKLRDMCLHLTMIACLTTCIDLPIHKSAKGYFAHFDEFLIRCHALGTECEVKVLF